WDERRGHPSTIRGRLKAACAGHSQAKMETGARRRFRFGSEAHTRMCLSQLGKLNLCRLFGREQRTRRLETAHPGLAYRARVCPEPIKAADCPSEAIASGSHGLTPCYVIDLQALHDRGQVSGNASALATPSNPSGPIHQCQILS